MESKTYRCLYDDSDFIKLEEQLYSKGLSFKFNSNNSHRIVLSEEQALDLANEIINYYKK